MQPYDQGSPPHLDKFAGVVGLHRSGLLRAEASPMVVGALLLFLLKLNSGPTFASQKRAEC